MKTRTKSRAEARAARWLYLAKRAGSPLSSPEFVAAVVARGERRDEEIRQSREEAARAEREKFAGYLSVTATAQGLGVRRTHLFALLESMGWLVRDEVGAKWCAADDALTAGWIVQRGPRSIEWPQLTPEGRHEIALRLGLDPTADRDE
ncbi:MULTISPECIES: phage antirepressor KilAC domain-containing protein [Paraburkholderia]|uniref:Uncharacterized protein n=1 Tax=Paraburkholderia podalyriae TaxID=1938811 RepID=A0ABR7PQK6_9BURK|nr:phage antirepressor KilAC domain-containing protein [Paraburkholderia podalyriae]MBC8748527.1 hypothetical protein [Paraburkholderia podalyriae]